MINEKEWRMEMHTSSEMCEFGMDKNRMHLSEAVHQTIEYDASS